MTWSGLLYVSACLLIPHMMAFAGFKWPVASAILFYVLSVAMSIPLVNYLEGDGLNFKIKRSPKG